MTRPLLACAIIGLWLICLAPTMPTKVQEPTPLVQTDTAKAVHAPPASVDLGPSVSLSYAFPALLADSAAAYSWGYMGSSVDGGSMTDSHLSTLNTLPFAYYFYYYDVATSYTWVAMDVVTVFQGLTGVGTYNTQHDLQVCYSGITTFTWNITTWFYDISTNAWVQQDCHVGTPAGPGGTYTLQDTPSLTYTTSYIDATGDFRVKVRGWAQISAAGGGYIIGNRMRMNQPRTTRTSMTETRRPTYAITGATLLYTLAFMAPESMTSITVTYPIAWDWQSLQPNSNVAETSGQVVITNTDQDTVYSASFTAPVLATSNWQSVYGSSFEALGNNWTLVVDGAASYKLGSTGVTLTYATTTPSWVIWSSYGSVVLTYKAGSTATAGAAGRWMTSCTFASAGIDSLAFTTANSYVDAVAVYQSDVSAGSTLSGTTRHVHPMGATAAAFTNVSLGLWTQAYAWAAYGSAVTDADGAWSLAASALYGSLSAQAYKVWTWVYAGANAYWALDAATEATTDWSESLGASSTWSAYAASAKEGAYSVRLTTQFDTSDYLQPTYNPSGSWAITDTLLTLWFYLNDTSHMNTLSVYAQDTGGKYAWRVLFNTPTYYYGLTLATWTRITVPLKSGYLSSIDSGFNWALVNSFLASCHNTTNSQPDYYDFRFDSFNFLQKYTSDTLTYPFAAPSDWTLQGGFSFNDVYGWANVFSNYAASYTLYEDDASKASGSIAANGDNIRWTLQTVTGNVSVGIAFTVPSYTGTKWLNTSYTIDLNPLTLITFGVATSQDMVQVWLVTSWRNTTVTITDRYDDTGVTTTMFSGSAESVGSWTYDAPHEPGNHTLTVTMDGGADSLTCSLVYAWDWPLDLPLDIGVGPGVKFQLDFTTALAVGLVLLVVVGFIAMRRQFGSVKNLLRGTEAAPKPRRRRTEAEEYDQAGKDYDKITREAHGT